MAGSKRAPAKAADPEPAADEAPAGESPVVALISKRLRNLRKKLKNVEALEAMQRESKELDAAQLCSLAAKGAVKGAAEELERLLSSLQPALDDERATATAQGRALAAADAALAAATAPPPRAPTPPPPPAPTGLSPAQAEELAAQRVAALMEALYLSRLFDITEEGRPTFGAQMERSAAISWDSYTSAGNQDPLTPADLEAIAQFGRVLTSRAPTSTLAHREALRRCTALAQTWAARGSAPVPELGAVSMERLRDRCARVLSSEYCTQAPIMQTCTADTARQTAAAAAAAGAAGAALTAGPSSALFPPPATVDPLFGGGPPLWVGTQFGDYDPRNM